MRCTSPVLVTDSHGVLVHAPCGQCLHCRLNYARQWSIRIAHERLKYGDNTCVITLTYDDEHLPADRSVHKRDLQLFMKRLRKKLGVKTVRYFGVGEYGGAFGRPHYHCVLFGVPVDSPVFGDRHIHYEKGKPCGWHCDFPVWENGKTHIMPLTLDTANYVAGYILKKVKGKSAFEYYSSRGIEPEFVLMSRKPGIGQCYVNSHGDYYRVHPYVTIKGVKYPLPRYYVDKAGVSKSTRSLESIKREKKRYADFCAEYEAQGMSRAEILNLYDELLLQEEKNTCAKLNLKGKNRYED